MKTTLSIAIVLLWAILATAQEPNGSACKINNENWCGSGSLCGYWTDPAGREGALILTNAHVATTRIGDKMTLLFRMGGSSERTYTGENLIAAYSNRDAVDWAIVFVPGLTEDSGLTPVKLLKESPKGQTFTFTGAPACRFPVTVAVRLVRSSVPGVIMWQPPTIGGQSGSSLWNEQDGKRVAQILLTWIWGGNGAGQPTSLIWNNRQNKNAKGVPRPEGLELPPFPDEGRAGALMQDRGLEEGYHEAQEIRALAAVGVKELPIWHVPGDIEPPPPDGLTAAETAACLALKKKYDLIALSKLLLSVTNGDRMDTSEKVGQLQTPGSKNRNGQAGNFPLQLNEPITGLPKFLPFVEPKPKAMAKVAEWTPPPLAEGELYEIGQIHNGRQLTQRCIEGGECIFEWVLMHK